MTTHEKVELIYHRRDRISARLVIPFREGVGKGRLSQPFGDANFRKFNLDESFRFACAHERGRETGNGGSAETSGAASVKVQSRYLFWTC